MCFGATSQEAEAWFEDDGDMKSLLVNEGQLTFLAKQPEKPPLHSMNIITIDKKSMQSGWVDLQQCYENLDAIAKVEITYSKVMRNLSVISHQGVGAAHVQGQSVQLRNVAHHATLCIHAQVHVLRNRGGGRYELEQGPYHRRFLDGFYPFHLSMRIVYPKQELIVDDVLMKQGLRDSAPWSSLEKGPKEGVGPGMRLARADGELAMDSFFEGALVVGVRFKAR